MTEAAYKMFPTDAPATPAPVALPAGNHAPSTVAPQPAAAQAPQPIHEPDASKMFPSEARPDAAASVDAVLEPLASSAWFDGDETRAAEIRATSASLADDFRKAGTGADEIRAVMDITREHQANLFAGPLPDDMIREQAARGYEALAEAGVTDGDLALARRLVNDMEAKTPGIRAYLDQTGQGSDPRTIQAAIREARRRYGR